jgi:dTDP-4-amino-4,6-dideoxygalactose transaminase
MPSAPPRAFVHRTYRPRLPEAAALLPYLQEIDANTWYSNFGPLLQRFEARLAAHYGLGPDRVVSVANCTLGLTLALQSCDPAPGGLCALPSWTFAATAAAARQAGLVPWFLDVDPQSWQLTPAAVEAALASAPGPLAAVMPVAPFGAAVEPAAWDAFRADHALPVVLDAAAAFDRVTAANAPAVVSLHATKPLGIGEGGFVLCATAAQAEQIRRRSNFGFDRHHEAVWPGGNAKLSEYAAAVGLAALDAWPGVRRNFADAAERYRQALASSPRGFEVSPSFAAPGVGSCCNIVLERPQAAAVVEGLQARGIEARRWWGGGCHAQPAYADCPRAPLPVTEDLARRVVALPYHAEMTAAEIAEVTAALNAVIAELA